MNRQLDSVTKGLMLQDMEAKAKEWGGIAQQTKGGKEIDDED